MFNITSWVHSGQNTLFYNYDQDNQDDISSVISTIAVALLAGAALYTSYKALRNRLAISTEDSNDSAISSRLLADNSSDEIGLSVESTIAPVTSSSESDKIAFEEGLDRWLHDESVTGKKAEAVRRIKEAYNNRSTILDLSFLNLTSLPSEIGNLTRLNRLDLSYNRLQTLPPEIGNLTLLTWLDLKYNKLQSLPSQIGNLILLEQLDLFNNELQILPPEVENLTQLTGLDLDSNQLQTLPPQIGNLIRLTSLDLNSNQLQTLPVEIGKLTQLKKLYLEGNLLHTLPPQIRNLTELKELSLGFNPLKPLPAEMSEWVDAFVGKRD